MEHGQGYGHSGVSAAAVDNSAVIVAQWPLRLLPLFAQGRGRIFTLHVSLPLPAGFRQQIQGLRQHVDAELARILSAVLQLLSPAETAAGLARLGALPCAREADAEGQGRLGQRSTSGIRRTLHRGLGRGANNSGGPERVLGLHKAAVQADEAMENAAQAWPGAVRKREQIVKVK